MGIKCRKFMNSVFWVQGYSPLTPVTQNNLDYFDFVPSYAPAHNILWIGVWGDFFTLPFWDKDKSEYPVICITEHC